MIYTVLKVPYRYANSLRKDLSARLYLSRRLRNKNITPSDFDFDALKGGVLKFLETLRELGKPFAYRYSDSCTQSTLYASAYACMTLSLLGCLRDKSQGEKKGWARYFDSFQSEDDGLFYDSAVINDLYADTDWWGARHLALHMISAYTDLGARPQYPFKFLEQYYSDDFIKAWLDKYDWSSSTIGVEDVDNKIMNIGCLLQYQRDYWDDASAGSAVGYLKSCLKKRLNPKAGMWGGFDTTDPNQRSRMVQFAYHLFPLYFYDNDYDEFQAEVITNHVLDTQNKYGGYGVKLNSSACEDIDSIDILIRFYPFLSSEIKARIDSSIKGAFKWVMVNQVEDKGFVFRLNEPFVYGSNQTSSGKNRGAMLPTWFRLLSIAHMTKHLKIDQKFILNTAPGLVIECKLNVSKS